jgi:serine/threonine-protein kinase HipA
MPRRSRSPLGVFLNGRRVGELRRFSSGAIAFAYDADWLAWEHALPVSLSLPLREDRYVGAPVIAVFENLLPDGEIRRRLAERVRADGHDAYSLLTKVGSECVGALQLLPDGYEPGPVGAVEGRVIDDNEVARKIAHLASSPLGIDDADDFRISLAGAHEKMALLW